MARGPRPGAANRTDLATPTPAPIQTAPGQTYGEAGAQQAAQHAIPTANGPTMPASPGAPASLPPQGAPGLSDIMAQATQHAGPSNSLAIDRPTERPDEPVTHGLPGGPGAGPEALQGVGALVRDNVLQQGTLAQFLRTAASQPNATGALRQLAMVAQAGVQ